jgi:hypothetical protein
MSSFAVNSFARRQTPESGFSHFGGGEDQLLAIVKDNFDNAKPGYRDGVVLVPVPPEGFFSGVTALTAGQKMVGTFEGRRAGEEPRKQLRAAEGAKLPAAAVDIVLYRHDVLGDDASTEATWEVVSINARPTVEEEPIHPETLLHNHFGSDGGTETGMTDAELVAQLRESFLYWKDKAMLA